MDPSYGYLVEEQGRNYGRKKRHSVPRGESGTSAATFTAVVLGSLALVLAIAAFVLSIINMVQFNDLPPPTPAPSPVTPPAGTPVAPPLAPPLGPPLAAPTGPPLPAPIGPPLTAPVSTPPRIGFSAYLANSLAIPANTNATLINWTTSNATYPGYYTTANFDPVLGRYTAPSDAIYLVSLYSEAAVGPAVGSVFVTFTCFIDVSGKQTLFIQDGIYLNNNQIGQFMISASTPLALNTGASVGVLCGASTLPANLQGNPTTGFSIERIAV